MLFFQSTGNSTRPAGNLAQRRSGRLFAICFSACGILLPAFAQTSPSGDTAWSNVVELGKAAAAPNSTLAPRTTETIRTEQKARAEKFREVAKGAKDFRSQYPQHANAAQARKLEALAVLEGMTSDDPAYFSEALRIATDYRNDKRNAASDRFEVASAIERGELSRKLAGRPWFANAIQAEMLADKLRREFGELPEVYGFYLAAAEHGSCFNSGDVAIKILQATPPAGIRASAQRVYDRWKLIGKPLDLALTRNDGVQTSLGALAGKRTVVVIYAGDRDPAGPSGLQAFRNAPPTGVNWVYVAVGAIARQSTISTPVPGGTHCVEPLGLKGEVAKRLNVSKLPAAYVIDGKKTLFGFGRIDDLRWLLAKSDPALFDHSAP